ncbi:endonuclease [Candidatus Thorarchaeota archaeon]|jgi:predicted Holliday junction resolvase-like endonuclease|nr:MAG: endonuclease [Candidatus Thorarchaeota archaeon]
MAFEDILLGLLVGLVVAGAVYLIMKMQLRHRISIVQKEFEKTWAEQESSVRKDAAERSRYVLKGKIAEHMVPMLSDVFKYDPSDARFIGAPIDYLIFDGYTEVKDGDSSRSITVVLADIKTGKASLNRTERKIKEAVEAGRVKWETIRLDF